MTMFQCWALVSMVALAILAQTGATYAQDSAPSSTPASAAAGRPQIAVYYFPNYHPNDARNRKDRGEGWTEWNLVKEAKPRFEGHAQPKVPAWGYTDESDPKQMAQKIDAAADHGIDAFIFDWYYYEDGLFLERGLEQGFMKAPNNARLKFGLMWANHDWLDIFPASLNKPAKLLYPGKLSPKGFDKMTDYVIATYFKHPSYWMIDGKPYFSIYDLQKLIESFGSLDATREALDHFRQKTKLAGFPGLHINAVVWDRTILPGEKAARSFIEIVKSLGFDSVGSYVWVHHAALKGFPAASYAECKSAYFTFAKRSFTKYEGVPYYPNVSMGWDPSPRTDQSGPYENNGYPYTPILTGNTPEAFKGALAEMKTLLEARPAAERILSINSWNEWTEGSYIEPDTVNGMKYLEAIRDVFGVKILPKNEGSAASQPAPATQGAFAYPDGRPVATLRMDARDQGMVLQHGDGPGQCDFLGARDVWAYEANGVYYMHYDGAGPKGWLACLATSADLVNWTKKGAVLDFGKPGEDDSASASYGVTFFDGKVWHMFYLGTPHATKAPDFVPAFPYLTMKAKSDSPAGPWTKQGQVTPFRTKAGTYYSATASPGQVIPQDGGYLMFFSASTDGPTKRTIGIARTKDLDGAWTIDPKPIVPLEEQIENTSLYFEPANKTWFLFTNHIGLKGRSGEYTDAIWVYWTKDLNKWDAANKAVVLDGKNCTWSRNCIGVPAVMKVGNRLAVVYDAPGGESTSHMKRDVGLAWLGLPLVPPG